MPLSLLKATLVVPVLALAIAGCDSSSAKTSTSPTPAKCQVAASVAQGPIGAGGGASSLTVNAAPECTWAASTNAGWITGLTPSQGQGNGEVRFQVAANPSTNPRTGQITLNEVNTPVIQAGATCQFSLTPVSQFLGTGAETGTVDVSTATECAWTATSNAPWLVVTSGGNGTGNGKVGFSAMANTGATRVGTIAIGDQTFTATQLGSCVVSLNPASQPVGTAGGAATAVTVTTAVGCAWFASTSDGWIALAAPAAGNGSGTFGFSVTANTGPARTGTIVVGNATHAVMQAGGCTFSLDSTSASFPSAQSTGGPVTVTAAAGCTWAATSNASWLTVLTGANGSGNGTVTFNVDANTSGAARTGTLTIAGVTFTVTQAWP